MTILEVEGWYLKVGSTNGDSWNVGNGSAAVVEGGTEGLYEPYLHSRSIWRVVYRKPFLDGGSHLWVIRSHCLLHVSQSRRSVRHPEGSQ